MDKPLLCFEDFHEGQTFETSGRTVTDADIRLFIGATGDEHPNHVDAEYCRQHPIFDRPCAQGVLVLGVIDGFIAEAVTKRSGLCLNYGHDKIRYLKPVYPGDTLTATLRVTETASRNEEWGLVTVLAEASNQEHELVLINYNKLLIRRRGAIPN